MDSVLTFEVEGTTIARLTTTADGTYVCIDETEALSPAALKRLGALLLAAANI